MHTLDGSSSTLPVAHEELIIEGAAGSLDSMSDVICGGFDDLGQNFASGGIDGVKVSCAVGPLIVNEQPARGNFRFGGG